MKADDPDSSMSELQDDQVRQTVRQMAASEPGDYTLFGKFLEFSLELAEKRHFDQALWVADEATDRVAEAEAVVANPDLSPGLDDADRVFLSSRLGNLRRAIDDRGAVEQLLHGEPHQGNVLSTKNGPLFIDLETCCRGPVEFDLAHVAEAVCEHYPSVNQGLLDDCRQLVLAMVAAWRWDLGDQFPNGRRFGEELLRLLRAGPPWPTLDLVTGRLDGL